MSSIEKNHTSKVRFETEFALYRELTATCSEMVNNVIKVYKIISFSTDPEEDFKKACRATEAFSNLLRCNAPFISKTLDNQFRELIGLCDENIRTYQIYGNKNNDEFSPALKEIRSERREDENRTIVVIQEVAGKRPENVIQDEFDARMKAYTRTGEINNKYHSLIDVMRNYLEQL